MIRGGRRDPSADVESGGTRGQGLSRSHRGSFWQRPHPGSPLQAPLSLHLTLGVRQGPWRQRGARWGGRRWRSPAGRPGGLSCCSRGRRRGPARCCCTRPGACPAPGSRRGPRGPGAGCLGPAPSSACKQAECRQSQCHGQGQSGAQDTLGRREMRGPQPTPSSGLGSAGPGGRWPAVRAQLRCTQVSFCAHRACAPICEMETITPSRGPSCRGRGPELTSVEEMRPTHHSSTHSHPVPTDGPAPCGSRGNPASKAYLRPQGLSA